MRTEGANVDRFTANISPKQPHLAVPAGGSNSLQTEPIFPAMYEFSPIVPAVAIVLFV